jgi:gliding motility-associated-like protein
MKAITIILFILPASLFVYSQGPRFNWARQTGSSGNELSNSITLHSSGYIYNTGSFSNSVDFDLGPGVTSFSANDHDIFVSKYDTSGNFIWAKQFASNAGFGNGTEIKTDPQGNIYVTGIFTGTVDFDPGPGTFNIAATTQEIFVLKLNAGGDLVWAKDLGHIASVGGSGTGRGNAISLDANGNIYVAGTFYGIGDFDPGPAIYNLGANSAESFVFVTKLDQTGNFIWAKATRGGTFSETLSMAVENIGSVYITGGFVGYTDFDPGPGTFNLHSSYISSTNIFLFKLDASGNFSWAGMMEGGPGFGASIVADNAGNIYSTGKFAGLVDFDPGPGVSNLFYSGTADIYVSRLTTDGNFMEARRFGGNSDCEGTGIALGIGGQVYLTGIFSGTVNFKPGNSTYDLHAAGNSDIFIAELNAAGLSWVIQMGGTLNARTGSITTGTYGDIYTTGIFNGITDFDFGPAVYNLSSNGLNDAFIHKISHCVSSAPHYIHAADCSSYILNGQTYTASGTYTQFFTNAGGCDSTVILSLLIGGTKKVSDVQACDNFIWNGQILTHSGIYSDTLKDINGCDSILVLNLQVGSGYFIEIDTSICPGQSYGGHNISGTYTDRLTATNGCDSIRKLNLVVTANCLPVAIPNAFTPNNDSKNNLFKPVFHIDISDYSMIIFNRYGQKVFETRDWLQGWDGRYHGIDQQLGSYIYAISYKNNKGLTEQVKGTVMLLR